jgi:hypothetical protein
MKKLLLGFALIVLPVSYLGHHFYVDSKIKEVVDNYSAQLASTSDYTIQYDDYGYNFSQQAYVNNVRIKSETGIKHLGNIQIDRYDVSNQYPHYLDISISNVSLATLNISLLNAISDEKTRGKLSLSYEYLPDENKSLSVSLDMGMVDADSIALTAKLEGFDLIGLNKALEEIRLLPADKTPFAMMSLYLTQMDAIKLGMLSVSLKNQTLLPKFISNIKKAKGDPALNDQQITEMVIGDLHQFMGEAEGKESSMLVTGLEAFLRGQQSLTVHMEPSKPISLSQVGIIMATASANTETRMGVPEKLGLTLSGK